MNQTLSFEAIKKTPDVFSADIHLATAYRTFDGRVTESFVGKKIGRVVNLRGSGIGNQYLWIDTNGVPTDLLRPWVLDRMVDDVRRRS